MPTRGHKRVHGIRHGRHVLLSTIAALLAMIIALPVQAWAASSITTDKTAYGWNDDVIVTASSDDTGAWVGMYNEGSTPNVNPSLYWYYVRDFNGTPTNIYSRESNNEQFEVGKKILAIIGSDGTVLASTEITVTPNSSLSSSKKTYDYKEPIEITASSDVANSWIALITTGLNYTNWSYVKSESEVYNLAEDQTVPPGTYTVALFAGGGYAVDKTIPVTVARTYNDPTWTHNEDYSEFTATFTATDDASKTVTAKVTGDDITSVVKDPTCESAGQTVYTAALNMTDVAGFRHKDGKTSFEGKVIVPIKALGHDWGEWTVVTPATETTEGLERRVCKRDGTHVEERPIPVASHEHRLTHVEAKDATCEEPGNVEYWVCDIDADGYTHCGKYFSDAEGKAEIALADTVVPAKKHAYGDWKAVEGTRTHQKVCANDPTHVLTEDCTFGEGVAHGNKVTYTCTVCGNSYEEDAILFTDKEEYAFSDPIMVTATAEHPDAWVGLYEKGATPPSSGTSLYYHYVNGAHNDAPTSGSGQAFDAKKGTAQGSLSAGQYDIILFGDGGYNEVARVTITISAPRESELSIDRAAGEDGRIAYKLGEPIVVSAVSDHPGAWVGLYPYSKDYPPYKDSDPLDQMYYKSFSVAGNDGGFDIMQGSDGPNTDQLVPGRYKVVLFDGGYDVKKIKSFYLDEAYNDPTFDWSDDHKTCTAVFTATHDDTVTKEIEATVSEQITTQPKCTESGAATYTASVSVPATGDDAFATVSGQTEFSDVQENVEVAALGHDWGEWTEVTPATETAEGLERRVCTRDGTHVEERPIPVTSHEHRLTHVEAKDATCEEPGNVEYWVCDQGDNPCGKYFSDAEGKAEIEKDSVDIAKLGHKYGDWVYDDATGTHTKVCANDSSHVITENCSYGEEVLKDGAYTKTCKVCGGTHVGDVLLSTDKKVYTSGDPVMVTANYDDENAWVGLYKKGEKVDPDNGGVKSIYWYYLADEGNPTNILATRDENERTLEDGTADYTVALLTKEGDNWYKLVTSVDITIEVPAPPANPLHTDKDTYDLNEPIMVDAQCYNAGAWVGMYKKGEIPSADLASIFWYYVAEEDNPANILATRDENGRGGEYAPGEFTIVLFGNGSYDNILATKDITITASTIEADPVTLKLNDEDVTPGASKEFLNGTKVSLQPGCEGNPGASWVGIYDKAVSAADSFGAIKAIDRFNVSEYLDKPYELEGCADGTWSAVVFGGVGYNQVKTVVTMTFRKDHTETVTKEPTCTEAGQKRYDYADGTSEFEKIDPLGHDWGDWSYIEAEHKHTRTCKRDASHVETVECTFGEPKVIEEVTASHDGLVEYTCTVCGGTYQETIPAEKRVLRVSGNDRYDTALVAADELKSRRGVESFDTIVVACGTNFADALSGSYLANRMGAPIILVNTAWPDTEKKVKDYITANLSEGGTVYVLGGNNAVASSFDEGLNVKRLAGTDRYETNLKILEEAGVDGEDILVVTGTNFADSLSASAANRPILMVGKSLTDEQKQFVQDNSASQFFILGGTLAVSEDVKNVVDGIAASPSERIHGSDRQETSVLVAQKFFDKPSSAVVAYALDYPDGLCGGTLANALGAPLILTNIDNYDAAESYLNDNAIKNGYVLGGEGQASRILINDSLAKLLYGSDPVLVGE